MYLPLVNTSDSQANISTDRTPHPVYLVRTTQQQAHGWSGVDADANGLQMVWWVVSSETTFAAALNDLSIPVETSTAQLVIADNPYRKAVT